MPTKSLNFYIGIIVALAPVCIGGAIGYGGVQKDVENTKVSVQETLHVAQKIAQRVEENKDRIIEQEKVNLQQSILLDRTAKIVERLEKRTEP